MISAWLCSAILCVPFVRGDFERLPAPALEADLDSLKASLESLHPGLHRYATTEEMDAAFRRARGEIAGGGTVPEFFAVVSELVAGVHCGHTRARLPDDVRRTSFERKRVLPFTVRLLQDKVYVEKVLLGVRTLSPGAEIRSIDGRPIGEIVTRLLAVLSGDGRIETGKRRGLEAGFATLYALFVPGTSDSFALGIIAPGATAPSTVEVAGAAVADVDALALPPSTPRFSLQVDRPAGLAVMDIRSFTRGGPIDYEQFLAESFARLESEEIGALIIDLRGNGGGADQWGALLVSYLTDKPFRYFDRIEVTEGYTEPGGIARSADGRRLVTTHAGTQQQEPAEHSFLGRVCMLIDGGTFSTAADVATVAHHLGLARFVGEESGGGYDGNTSGDSQTVLLPSSRISVTIPMWMYTTANIGHRFPGRGVMPDVFVTPTIQEVLAHDDVGMRRARELLKAK